MKDIDDKAKEFFNYLTTEYGFTNPIIKRDSWITTITFLEIELGIELELDYRDMDIFIIFVKLEHGKIPSDYFFSGVNKNRAHLETIINFINKRKRVKSRDEFVDRLEKYSELLKLHLPTIILESGKIFC